METRKKLPKRLSSLKAVVMIASLIVSGMMFTVKQSFASAGPTPSTTIGICQANFITYATGLNATFTDISFSTDTIVSWSWTLGDGNTSTLQNPTHTYASAGTYNVCLSILSSSGCSDKMCAPLYIATVPSSCKAAFAPSIIGLTVNFINVSYSTDTVINWNWTFGDGTTSTLQNPSHTYASAGTYNVCLALQSSKGCTDTVCTSFTVISTTTPPTTCKAAFTNTAIGLKASFNDASFTLDSIISWSWNFGDGGTSSLQNPTHTYATKGLYNVCLAIQSLSGCSDTSCYTIYVDTNTVSVPPLTGHCKAAFVDYTTNGFTDLSQSFTDITFSFSAITSWNWSFGDGGTSTLQNPAHLYSSAGNYNVCLAIQDATGCRDTACMNVFVTSIPTFTVSPMPNVCAASFITHANGLTASFTDQSFTLDTLVSWSWTFGDGGTSSLQNPSHTYNSAGLYNVCLTVKSSGGCSDNLCYSIYVDTGLVYLKKPLVTPAAHGSSSIADKHLSDIKMAVYPNPATESTSITYSLPADGYAKVAVLDLLGNEIEVLANTDASKGEHTILWKTSDVPSGIYLVRIMANDNVVTKKLTVIK